LFGGEFNLLEIRLHELYDTVDFFVLVESNFTLQNTPKPLYYDLYKHHFSKFHDKIVHVNLECYHWHWYSWIKWVI